MKLYFIFILLILSSCSTGRRDYAFFKKQTGLKNINAVFSNPTVKSKISEYLESYPNYEKGVAIIKNSSFLDEDVPELVIDMNPDYLYMRENVYMGINYVKVVHRVSFTFAHFMEPILNENDVKEILFLDNDNFRSMKMLNPKTWFIVNEY